MGGRRTRAESEQLVKEAREGRFPPSAWASEFVREYCDVEDVKGMDYEIQEVLAE